MGGPLYTEIKEKYTELKGNCQLTLEEVIDSLEIVLPKADTAIITAQNIAYTDYCTFIEAAIEVYISENMIKDLLVGEHIGVSVEDIKLSLLNMLKRQYLRAENMLPELDTLLTNTDANIGLLLGQHNEIIVDLVSKVLMHTRASENKEDALIAKQDEQFNPPETEEGADMGDSDSNDDGSDTDAELDDPTTDITDVEGDDMLTEEDTGTDDLVAEDAAMPDELTDDDTEVVAADADEELPEEDDVTTPPESDSEEPMAEPEKTDVPETDAVDAEVVADVEGDDTTELEEFEMDEDLADEEVDDTEVPEDSALPEEDTADDTEEVMVEDLPDEEVDSADAADDVSETEIDTEEDLGLAELPKDAKEKDYTFRNKKWYLKVPEDEEETDDEPTKD